MHLTLSLSTRMIPLIALQDYPTLQVHPNPWNQHVLTRFLHLISPPLIQNSLTLSGLFSKAHIHTFEKHIYFMSWCMTPWMCMASLNISQDDPISHRLAPHTPHFTIIIHTRNNASHIIIISILIGYFLIFYYLELCYTLWLFLVVGRFHISYFCGKNKPLKT